uniref:tripartite motif-containing protein 16-like n=1 Tax=Solea senegalensis TaxID=28829 RepID=UPI001CD8521F|nr:tripartite motif-containing protein 16-like [Solea senegalensis]
MVNCRSVSEMAQKGVQLRLENFSCAICMELLKNPVTIPCGHSFCLNCIKTFWDGRTISSCPQCRKTFRPRPDLTKNFMLADLVEELKKPEVHAAPAGVNDVVCDVCGKLKALRSCVVCLASYCEKHLQPHYHSPAFKKHKLMEPSKHLQKNICSRHVKMMKMFCRSDLQHVCYLCSVENSASEPKTRAQFLTYSQEITLDPNTANDEMLLSEGNRKVTATWKKQCYPRHKDRFTDWWQVLSKESLTGHCYWEVEWRGGGVRVAVTYKSISRSGDSHKCKFGYNDKSWALYCYQNSCDFYHNSIRTKVSDVEFSRVGVYLDNIAGLLSFYRVSDTMSLLHRVQTTFTQPLYAGVGLYFSFPGDTFDFCKLK